MGGTSFPVTSELTNQSGETDLTILRFTNCHGCQILSVDGSLAKAPDQFELRRVGNNEKVSFQIEQKSLSLIEGIDIEDREWESTLKQKPILDKLLSTDCHASKNLLTSGDCGLEGNLRIFF